MKILHIADSLYPSYFYLLLGTFPLLYLISGMREMAIVGAIRKWQLIKNIKHRICLVQSCICFLVGFQMGEKVLGCFSLCKTKWAPFEHHQESQRSLRFLNTLSVVLESKEVLRKKKVISTWHGRPLGFHWTNLVHLKINNSFCGF